jgi:hypothetical protein
MEIDMIDYPRLSQPNLRRRATFAPPILGIVAFLLAAVAGVTRANDSLFSDTPARSKPPASAVELSVISLEVRKELDPKLTQGLFVPGFGGTSISLLVGVPDKVVIGLDHGAGKLTRFTDDRGTDLSKAHPRFFDIGLSQFAQIAPDGHHAMVKIQSGYAPAMGATKIIADGTLVALCGANLKTVLQDAIPLQKGAKFKLGTLELEVENLQDVTVGTAKMWVSFKSATSLQAINGLRFLTADGKEIKSQDGGGGELRRNNVVFSYTRQYTLDEKAASVTIEAKLWGQVESLQIPINLDVSVGLDAARSAASGASPGGEVPAAEKRYLADLKELEVSMGTFGTFGKNGDKGYTASGTDKILLNGKPAPHGLSLHPPPKGSSFVRYQLDGRYQTFRTIVGITDGSPHADSPLTFRVIGDGKVLWHSSPLAEGGQSDTCDIPINGVKDLKLELVCPGRNGHCYGVWVDPQVAP